MTVSSLLSICLLLIVIFTVWVVSLLLVIVGSFLKVMIFYCLSIISMNPNELIAIISVVIIIKLVLFFIVVEKH